MEWDSCAIVDYDYINESNEILPSRGLSLESEVVNNFL